MVLQPVVSEAPVPERASVGVCMLTTLRSRAARMSVQHDAVRIGQAVAAAGVLQPGPLTVSAAASALSSAASPASKVTDSAPICGIGIGQILPNGGVRRVIWSLVSTM